MEPNCYNFKECKDCKYNYSLSLCSSLKHLTATNVTHKTSDCEFKEV